MKIEFEPTMYTCLITPLYVAMGRLDGYIHYLNVHKTSSIINSTFTNNSIIDIITPSLLRDY